MGKAELPPFYFEWDDEKNQINLRKHGLPLEAALAFDWSTSCTVTDDRNDYGEERFVAFGYDSMGHFMSLCFTERGNVIRFISYRRCTEKEARRKLEQGHM